MRRSRRGSRQHFGSANDFSWFLTLPEKARPRQSTTRDDHIWHRGASGSVILDAADEAVYKARRESRNLTSMIIPPTPSSVNTSPDTERTFAASSPTMADTMLESFRWMDEEDDLDLRLALDDYHANLDGAVLPNSSSLRRPSFRRTMSISKSPFGRNSMSPTQPTSPKPESVKSVHKSHIRQRSRAMSLISPRHNAHESISSIDPNATHYQDPEARLKLRVYLASPQKFDEAIEFGFPSLDAVTEGANKENKPPRRAPSRDLGPLKTLSSEDIRSFLDDALPMFEDDASMLDPESPVTPMGMDHSFQPQFSAPSSSSGRPKMHLKAASDYAQLGTPRPGLIRHADTYPHAMAGNREMTLRMTLTRPDLRADETAIYGWQNTQTLSRGASLAIDRDETYGVKGPFGGDDGWGPPDKDNGGLKRFWRRVKSSQRKSSS